MALSIKPNFSQSLNNLGVVYTVQVCSSVIIFFVAQFLLWLSSYFVVLPYYQNNYVHWFIQGKMDAAASMIEKAIIANSTYGEAYNNLGNPQPTVAMWDS
jgi:protein O-GlcNAc transferase